MARLSYPAALSGDEIGHLRGKARPLCAAGPSDLQFWVELWGFEPQTPSMRTKVTGNRRP